MLRWFVAAAVLAVVALPARAAEEGEVRVALLPMVVHSAEDPRYLREGMADMLESRLARAGRIRVLRVDEPKAATTRLSEALARARQLDADYVLYGSFTRFGEGASLDLTCAPTREDAGEQEQLREIFVQSGSIEEVIPALSDLVGKVALFLESDGTTAAPSVATNGHPEDAPAEAAPAAERASDGSAAAEIEALRSRIEALEAIVYGDERGPASGPAR